MPNLPPYFIQVCQRVGVVTDHLPLAAFFPESGRRAVTSSA
jgi:hypothetical protein